MKNRLRKIDALIQEHFFGEKDIQWTEDASWTVTQEYIDKNPINVKYDNLKVGDVIEHLPVPCIGKPYYTRIEYAVYGYINEVPKYSSDLKDTWKLIEELKEAEYDIEICTWSSPKEKIKWKVCCQS